LSRHRQSRYRSTHSVLPENSAPNTQSRMILGKFQICQKHVPCKMHMTLGLGKPLPFLYTGQSTDLELLCKQDCYSDQEVIDLHSPTPSFIFCFIPIFCAIPINNKETGARATRRKKSEWVSRPMQIETTREESCSNPNKMTFRKPVCTGLLHH